jgi:hypothetical protein
MTEGGKYFCIYLEQKVSGASADAKSPAQLLSLILKKKKKNNQKVQYLYLIYEHNVLFFKPSLSHLYYLK